VEYIRPDSPVRYALTKKLGGHELGGCPQDSEMIFSARWDRMPALIEGLQHVAQTGSKLPAALRMQPEYDLPESYVEMAREMDMEI